MITHGRYIFGCACWVLTIQAAQAADCSSTYDCTVEAGSYTSPYGLTSTGAAGSQDDDPGNGSAITIINDGDFSISSNPYSVKGQSSGGQPVDESTGGAGSAVTITSTGSLSLGQGSYSSEIIAIDARSIGADADRDNQNNGSSGGNGGAAGNVSVTNSGAINLGSSLPYGGIGIYGLSQGGSGGEGNTDFGVNQPGGDGGKPGTVTVDNSGSITMGSGSAPVTSGSRAWGIRIESNGGGGDPDSNTGDNDPASGDGAGADTLSVTNSGKIDIHVDGTGTTSGGAKGIYASAVGGTGASSSYNYNTGGHGGSGGTIGITVNQGGDINVSTAKTLSDGGAGIHGWSQGGNGGLGNKQDSSGGGGGYGGGGAGVTVNVDGASVTTSGDGLTGILGQSLGGVGGAGDTENNNSGGQGGSGSQIQINLESGGSITTNGDTAYGVLTQSIGGTGGNGGDGSALFGSAGSAGAGGDGGPSGTYTDSSTSITTSGDYAVGITVQSIGGGGGTGGDFVDVLGGGGGNGGNGGSPGNVAVNSSSRISTSGDHAYGILGQAIGGSGGHGGIAAGLGIELGGDGGDGGSGGTGNFLNYGDTTQGYASHGIVVQSIAGGGGAAGSAGGLIGVGGNSTYNYSANGGQIDIGNSGQITTNGEAAVGIIIHSIGGGGGTGGGSTGLETIGGKGTVGGTGGLVIVNGIGPITTHGKFAHGLLAQSVGGGGGNGGSTLDFSVGVPAVGIGGSAGNGGAGGTVCLLSYAADTGNCKQRNNDSPDGRPATVITHGDAAIGILAQSVGGGGNGGDATGYSGESIFNLQIGGNAGTASNGGIIDVYLRQLTLQTSGARSMGLVAHSVGGGGGNGGAASGYDGGVGYAAGLSVGGAGGSGGNGGAVTVNLSSRRITTGSALVAGSEDNQTTDAYGIVAQSIGGGGGNGGAATADDIDVAVPTGEGVSLAATVAMAVGGKSGSGGHGLGVDVELSDNTSISTFGQGSHGVIAQSIGGGGGNGGNSQALAATVGDEDTVAADVSVAVGGAGGDGGYGGSVSVAIGGQDGGDQTSIHTADDYANAVLAQSIGGGGGNAGVGSSNTYKLGGAVDIDLDIGLGGTGGSGSTGGTVAIDLRPYAFIVTEGSGSRGIVAQSIGSGGGVSQGGTVLLGGVAGGYSGDVEVGVGRKGSGGASGGTVTVDSYGAITTSGGDADGIFAQSIGGGGGLGGSMGNDASADHQLAGAISLIKDGESTYTFQTYVGGQGGSGGAGGAVQLDVTSTIQTAGDWADGIVAQSIGGGGGTGGTATASGSLAKATTEIGVGGQGGMAGDGGTISGTTSGTIKTAGYSAYGLLAQSIGGGGGQGGDGSDNSNATVTVGAGSGVGGSGGASGNGGTVDLTVDSTVSTTGDDAHGVVLQSIGSGGGTGGAGSSGTTSEVELTVTVGGRGGGSGSGGAVTLDGTPKVTTTGDRAFGIVAQSIGGGGGIGGTGSSENVLSLTLGGQGGNNVSSGTVTLNLSGGSVATSGQSAHGVVLQSIGGGGGIGGDSSGSILNFGGSGGQSDGNGGNISYTTAGSITTTGNSAFGIVAQSIGGGGGLGGSRSGAIAGSTASESSGAGAGMVDIEMNGSVSASGDNAIGIFAQSDAANPEKVSVEVNGAVDGGSGDQGVGIHIDEGAGNTVTIGSSGHVGAASAVAIRYTSSDAAGSASTLTITNNGGEISGTIDNATLVSGSQATTPGALGAAPGATQAISLDNRGIIRNAAFIEADMTNSGVLMVGNAGAADSTAVTGSFLQNHGATIIADVDLVAQTGDRLTINGDALLDGGLKVSAISLLPDRSAQVLTVTGAAGGDLQAVDSPIVDYEITKNGNGYTVRVVRADFNAPLDGRSMNERNLARHLQSAWDMGDTPALGRVFGDLDTVAGESIDRYVDALYDMTPGVAAAPAARASVNMQAFNDSQFSCPTFEDNSAIVREDSCFWAQVAGGSTDQDPADGADGFHRQGFTYQVGLQNELSPGWFLGLSAAYRQDNYDSDLSASDGDSALAGITLKHERGPWLFGLGLSGGYGWFDTSREVGLAEDQAVATSDPEVQNVGLRARAAYDFGGEAFYARPALDLDAIFTRQPRYTEKGAGDLDLHVDDSDQWNLVATPSLELGGRVNLTEGWMFRPFVRGGVSFGDQSSWTSSARLAGAPDGAGRFDTNVPIDDVVARATAGVQILNNGEVSVRAQYDGEFSDNITSHGGSVRVNFGF